MVNTKIIEEPFYSSDKTCLLEASLNPVWCHEYICYEIICRFCRICTILPCFCTVSLNFWLYNLKGHWLYNLKEHCGLNESCMCVCVSHTQHPWWYFIFHDEGWHIYIYIYIYNVFKTYIQWKAHTLNIIFSIQINCPHNHIYITINLKTATDSRLSIHLESWLGRSSGISILSLLTWIPGMYQV
jgi:hypothetical protein